MMVVGAAAFFMVVMTVTAAAFFMVVMTVTAAAFFMVVMLMTAAAFFMVVMLMPTAAFFMVVMLMTAAAAFMVVMLMTAAAAFMVVMLMSAAAAFMMIILHLPLLPGTDDHIRLNAPGDVLQLRDQQIRCLGSQPQLPGGKGDHSLGNLGMPVKLLFDLCSAVGAAKIFQYVDLSFHRVPSYVFILTYEHTLMC